MGIKAFFKKVFGDMKESAKAQHEVDKAEFQAAKAEAKANFEENKFHNTYAKAKADAKKNWDDAHMTPAQRAAKDQEIRDSKIAEANARTAAPVTNFFVVLLIFTPCLYFFFRLFSLIFNTLHHQEKSQSFRDKQTVIIEFRHTSRKHRRIGNLHSLSRG